MMEQVRKRGENVTTVGIILSDILGKNINI